MDTLLDSPTIPKKSLLSPEELAAKQALAQVNSEMTTALATKNPKAGLNRGGRPKGAKNIANRDLREAIKELSQRNFTRVQRWLDAIEKQDGPKAALDAWLSIIEYAVPKLGRVEVTGADQGPIQYQVSWTPMVRADVIESDRPQDVVTESNNRVLLDSQDAQVVNNKE